MKNACEPRISDELEQLCASVRAYVNEGMFDACKEPICRAMALYPDAPHPHNLLGIVLEKTGHHAAAMKHFRAAWALDPTYRPANHNMYICATFQEDEMCAFDESDVPAKQGGQTSIICDGRGIGHAVKNWRIEYDKHGVGHAVRS